MRRNLRALLISACIALFAVFGCGHGTGHPPTDDLIGGAVVRSESGVRDASRLTDGIVANPGDGWKTDLTARFESLKAFAEFDFGEERSIGAAYLQADSDDSYVVSGSSDGNAFTTIWEAHQSAGGGLQARTIDTLQAKARYVRITPRSGDGRYAVSEFALYSARPALFPPEFVARGGIPLDLDLRTRILIMGFALAALALFAPPRRSRLRVLTPVLAVLCLYTIADFVRHLADSWPPGGMEVSLVRAVAAGVACLVVLREAFGPKSMPANRSVGTGLLAVSALLALASFYNLGQPQFGDHRSGRPRFIHDFDMRVYYPVAKYWSELRYDGLYLASAAAFRDDEPNRFNAALAKTEIRNLGNFRVQKLSESLAAMERVKARFSGSRWDAFRADMRYFRQTMGEQDYLGSMLDHGANSTPLWMSVAHVIFAWTHASDGALTFGALLDPVLLALAFFAMYRAFGVRVALLTMVVFGANDFYMTGSNWAGSTLRHDWLALLAIGVSLLALERWRAGGAVLMVAAMIRAFPALALIGIGAPLLWWIAERARKDHELPTLRSVLSEQQPIARIAFGAFVAGVAAWLVSSLICGFHAWSDWLSRSAVFNESPAANEISLRFFLTGGDVSARLLASRKLLHTICLAGFVAAVFVAARDKKPHVAAVLGLLLTPIVFNPTNYYLHLVYLVPALGAVVSRPRALSARGAGIVIVLLLMCALQYLTLGDKDEVHHFWIENCFYMLWMMATLWLVARRETDASISRTVATR